MKDNNRAELKALKPDAVRISAEKSAYSPAKSRASGASETGSSAKLGGHGSSGNKSRHHRYGGFKGTALVVLLSFSMVFASILGAFADDLVNTVPAGEGYTGSITTFNDGKGADVNDTIVGKAPYSNNKVRQSTSTESATTFASGLPLSTIYIDQDKVKNSPNGKFNPLPGPHSQYLIANQETNGDGNTYWRVDYDAVNGPKMYGGTINELTGDLYYIIFPDAAILPDGSTADLKITYSNAKIVIDQRYAYDNTPYNGRIFLSKGGNFSYGGTDPTGISGMSYPTERQNAVNDVVHEFYPSGANFSNSNMNTPMIGKTMDATYQIVNKNEVPIEGTFIYAIAGINLDRDPYRGGASAGNNYGKPLWYINGLNEEIFNYQDTDYTVYKAPDGTKYIKKDTTSGEKYFELTSSGTTYIVDDNPASPQPVNPMVSYIYKKEGGKGTGGEEYHYFSESMSITGGQSSDYIYVRSNKNNLDDENNTATYDNQTHFYSQVSTDSNGNPWIIGNANMNVSNTSQASDTSYCSGFVTLADAAAGFKVTATGHGGYGNSAMNTNTFTSSTIWYRYRSGSGPHGRIELTDEGNHGGQLGDGGTVLPGGTIAVPNTYVVTEGKTVTYTMTPDIGYKMKKLTIGGEEVLFDREAVSKMKKGDSITVDTADSAYWTSHTTKEPIDPSRGQGILKYEEDGTYTFTFNHAKAHEEIFVEWEPTTADLYIAKIWKDNNDEDGLRSLIYGGSDKPKFKLQYSTNGGRNWIDVKTGETKNSDIANTPIHPERTYDDQEVPEGKVGGAYKDGTYYINNGTDGAYSATAAAPQPTSANLVPTFETCKSMVVLEDKNTRKRYVDVDGTYHEVEKADHPFTWEYLPVYTYDDSGIADRPISYRIVEDDDPVHRDYKKAQYFDSQAFELTSEKSKTWNGWQIYEDSTSGQHYILRGDGLYYEVSQNQDVENADGVMNPDPPSEQPDKNNLTPVSSNTYRTTDKAIPYQSEEILNEHTVRKLYVDVNKFWNDRDLLDAIATDANEYERVDLKFILSGETEDGPVDLNGDPGKENLELTVSPTETGAKYEKIDNYQIFKDTLGNQYAHVVEHATAPNGYYPVSGSTIDYTKAADVNPLDLSPIINTKYKVDDDRFGVCFNDLPTHDNGKNITYTVKEQFKIDDTWYDAGESEVSWVTNGGELNPERDSSHEVKGYETIFSNTPRIEDKYVTLPITIAKRDAKTTNVLLEGAEFTIYRNAITGEKALDNNDVKIEDQTIYTHGSLEYVKRTEQGETEAKYYTFSKNDDDTYTYTLANPQPKETDLKVKQGDVKSNVVYTSTQGLAMVEFQEPGTYYIQETKAPNGYTADPKIYAFIVNEELKTVTLKDVDDDHATKWWEKLYDMLFGEDTAPTTYDNWNKNAKTLTVDDEPLSANVLVRKYWEDNDDQDGVRPKDKLEDGQTDNPKTPKVILQWTTTAHTAEGLPVYTSGTKSYVHNAEEDKYYEVIEEDTIGTFDSTPEDPQPENVTETSETCQGRKVYKDGSDQKYVFVDEKYHKVTSVDTTGSVNTTAADPQPDEDELELIQNGNWTDVIIGTEDPSDPDPELAIERVSYAGGPVKTSQTDAYTWSNVKAYRDGKVVVYRVHETSPLITDGTYSIKYSHTSDTHEKVFTLVNQNGTTHNQTVDVTNKHETRVINIEAYKTWNDEDQSKRREATLTLWKEVNGARSIVTRMENGVAVSDTGTVPTTDVTDPVKTWKDLPAFEMGCPITYSIVETTIDGYKTVYEVDYTKAATDTDPEKEIEEEGSAIDASVVKRTYYTQADKDAGNIPQGKKIGDESTTAAFRIENEETINIDVEKTWVDGANANVTFELWRTTTPEADWDKSKFKEETICYQHNETGNRISVQDWDALPAADKANYTEQKGKNWSPYEDSTETTTVDGWKKVDSYEFAASRFEVSSTGDTKDYTFRNLPRQEVEVIDGKKVFKDGANNKFAFNETDKKYYAVNSDGTISDTPANPQPTSDSLSLSYLKYTYRILETPKLVRLAADQTDDFEVTNYNLHASSGFANVEVVKELQGREWNAGGMEDKFYFELDPQSATDTTDPTHTIDKDDIPLPTRTLERELYEGDGKYYVKDADDMYREVTVDTSTDPITYIVDDTPVNPQPKDTDLTDTGTKCEASVQYAVDSTKTKEVGAIGRAADFKSIEFSDETVIPRGHTVEFNYKVREVFDILGTSLADATNNTGKRDGISYADFDDEGNWMQAEHNLKIVVVNDLDGKMTTTILWDGATETGAVPVFTNKYSSESEAKAWIEKEIANRPWVDYANGNGDAFQYEVLAISGSQLNVPGADHSQGTDDSYTSKPLISNASGNPQDDIQKQSRTEYAFGLTGNKYTGDMLNSSGEGYFIYAISEKDKATSTTDTLGLSEYKVDGLTYDDSTIYAKVKVTDNWDGTLSFDVKYYSDAACRTEITNYKVWIQDKFTGGSMDPTAADPQPNESALIETTEKIGFMTVYADANGNRYVKDGDYYHEVIGGTETKRLLSQKEIADMAGMSDAQKKANGYVEKNVAHFTNRETVDIPVVKEWVGGPAIEDVNLHLVRHLYEMTGSFDEDSLTYAVIEADAKNWKEEEHGGESFWTTEGLTHIAKRGEFLKEDGTPDYDQGSSDTTTRTYENIDKFNKDLPKYVKKDGKMYRAVYKLVEDDTSDTYTTTYRSSKEGDEDTEGNAIFLGGETLIVTNTVTATNVAKIAAVKQFLGRNWASTDKFDFTLEPVGIGTYDAKTGALTGINDTTGKAKVPMPARYVNNNDPTDVKSISEYDELPDEQKANYTKIGTDSADAVSTDETVDKNGHLERLASFDEIFYSVNDLQYDPVEKHYQGDFYYIMKEKLPEITDDVYPVAYTSSTQTTEKEIEDKQLPTLAGNEKLKTVKFSNGITYDCDEHTVHVKVRENRTGKLQTQIAYDYDDFKDISTGTQYTPVYTNRYDAEGVATFGLDKNIRGRDWKSGDKFDFVMIPMAGAPFTDADSSEFPPNDTHKDGERNAELNAGYAVHNKEGEHVKRIIVTDETKDDTVQTLTFPKLKYTYSQLGLTAKENEIPVPTADHKPGTTFIPEGTAYAQFMYAIQESNAYGAEPTDLDMDPDTEYARITVVDKGDGTLDYYVEIFEDRYAQNKRFVPDPDTGEETEVPAYRVNFTNKINRDLTAIKAWDGVATEDVTLKLQWSVDDEHWYDVEGTAWLPNVEGTKIIKKGATGEDLKAKWTGLPAYANISEHDDKTGDTGDNLDLNDLWIYYQVIEEAPSYAEVRYNKVAYVAGDAITNADKYKTTPYHTGPEKDGDKWVKPEDRVKELHVTNFPKEKYGTADVNVVKQYIGKVWEDEEFEFIIEPVKSKLGDDEDYINEGAYRGDELNVLPKYNGANGNKAKVTATSGKYVSVNERSVVFDSLTIKRSDLKLNSETGQMTGEFVYKVKEVIPAGAKEITEGSKTYYVYDDKNGNKIKLTGEEHTVTITAIATDHKDLDITVKYDDRKPGEFVPVYTNYAMSPTPIEGTKTWIGGEENDHANGTVTLDENDPTIVTDSNDELGLKLHRKLNKEGAEDKPLTQDDAGRDLIIVWAKITPEPETYYVKTGDTEVDSDKTYYYDDKGQSPVTPEGDEVPADEGWYEEATRTVYHYKKQETGDGTYTIMAIDGDGNYVAPILNVVDADGYIYDYRIDEPTAPKGYEATCEGLDVTNTNIVTDSLKVSKTWDDAQGVDGTRPDKVIVHLYKEVIVPAETEGGEATTKTVQVEVDKKTITRKDGDDKDVWSKGEVFEDLPLYDNNGNVIKYFVLEEGIGGYTAKYAVDSTDDGDYKDAGDDSLKVALDGQKDKTNPESTTDNPQTVDIKNSLTPATSKIEVTKHWNDQDNADGARPINVTFKLKKYVWDPEANGRKGAYKTTAEPVTKRPATEADVEADITRETKLGDDITVTNMVLNGTATSPATEIWNETTTAAQKAAGTWKGEWINLPLTENGKTILYVIEEDTSNADKYGTPGTEGKYSNEPCIHGDQINGFEVTNEYTPEVTSFEGIKEWVDGDSKIKHNNSAELMDKLTLWRTTAAPDTWDDDTNWENLGTLAAGMTAGDFHVDWSSSGFLKPDNKFTITGLPKKSGEAKTYYYKVTETQIDGYDQTYDNAELEDEDLKTRTDAIYDGGTVENAAKVGDVEITKKFVDKDGNIIPKATLPSGFKIKVSYVWNNPETKKYEKKTDNLTITEGTPVTDGVYKWTLSNVVAGTKVAAEESGYDSPTGYSYVSSTATVNGDDEATHLEENPTYAEFTMPIDAADKKPIFKAYNPGEGGDAPASVAFVNTYKRNTGGIEPTKIWDDDSDAADARPDDVTFTITATDNGDLSKTYPVIDNGSETKVASIDYKMTKDKNTGDTWYINESGTFGIDNLPTHADDGKQICYVVTENNVPEGYQRLYTQAYGEHILIYLSKDGDYQTAEITNAYAEFEITKQWRDADGDKTTHTTLRPTADQFKDMLQLYAGTQDVTTANKAKLTVSDNEDGTYTAKWTGLRKRVGDDINSAEIVYSAKENPGTITGYAQGVYSDGDKALQGGTITNTQLISVDVVKQWDDKSNHEGRRPEKIKVKLFRNGLPLGDEVELEKDKDPTGGTFTESAGGNTYTWTSVWKDLPYADEYGVKYNYTAVEIDSGAAWYEAFLGTEKMRQILLSAWKDTSTKDTWVFTIDNKYEDETTGFTVDKIWDDGSNVDKLRPEKIYYRLYQDYEGIADTDKQIKILPTNTEVAITGGEFKTANNGYIEVNANKTDVTQGTLGRVTIKGLPMYSASGKLITYSIKEDADVTTSATTTDTPPENIFGYTTSIAGNSSEGGVTVTNTHTPGTAEVTPEAVKEISGRNFDAAVKDKDGFTFKIAVDSPANAPTPTPDWITVHPTTGTGSVDIPLGTFKFTGKDMTDKLEAGNTKEFRYKLTEVNGGRTIDDLRYDSSEKTLIVTLKRENDGSISATYKWDGADSADPDVAVAANRFTNIYDNTTKLVIRKIWSDDDADGTVLGSLPFDAVNELRPDEIDFTVTASIKTDDGVSDELVAEMEGAGFTQDGTDSKKFTQVITLKNSEDGTVFNRNVWQKTIDGLPKLDASGDPIEYKVDEEQLPNYQTLPAQQDEGRWIITNVYDRTEFEATKVWDDGGKKHDNATELELGGKLTLQRTVKENPTDGDWDAVTDAHLHWNSDGELTQDNMYKQSFKITGLPKSDAEGNEYTYRVVESSVGEGYTTTYSNIGDYSEKDDAVYDGGTITNTKQGKVTIMAKKIWKGDSNNTDGREEIKFQLYRTVDEATKKIGEPKAATKGSDDDFKPIEDSDNDDYVVWPNLPTIVDGNEATYDVKEVKVPEGYKDTTEYGYLDGADEKWADRKDDIPEGKKWNYKIKITNTLVINETQVVVQKKWDDDDDQDRKRPDSVTVRIAAKDWDGKDIDGEKVDDITLNDDNNWKSVWKKLPKTDSKGNVYDYTVSENPVGDYTTVVEYQSSGDKSWNEDKPDDWNNKVRVTNSYTPGKITVEVDKKWEGDEHLSVEERAELHSDVIVHLYGFKDEQVVYYAGSKKIEMDDQGEPVGLAMFANVPKRYFNDEDLDWKVVEDPVFGYTSTVSDVEPEDEGGKHYKATVTNTYVAPVTTVKVTKDWQDDTNNDGKRPDKVYYQLLKKVGDEDPVKVGTPVQAVETPTSPATTGATGQLDGWGYQWTKLPVTEEIETEDTTTTSRIEYEDVTKYQNKFDEDKVIDQEAYEALEPTGGKSSYTYDETSGMYVPIGGGDPINQTAYDTLDAQEDYYDPVTENVPVEKTEKNVKVKKEVPVLYVVTEIYNNKDMEELGLDDLPDDENLEKLGYKPPIVAATAPGEFKVINGKVNETGDIYVKKVWNDDKDKQGIRPDHVTFKLTGTAAGGYSKEYKRNLTEENAGADEDGKQVWSYVYKDLPVYKDGKEIQYTLTENNIPKYTASDVVGDGTEASPLTITNTYNPASVTLKATKKWTGDEANKSTRSDITFQLVKITYDEDSTKIIKTEVVEGQDKTVATGTDHEEDMTAEWNHLAYMEKGKRVAYTVQEENVPDGYNCIVGDVIDTGEKTEDGEQIFTVDVTNAYGVIPPKGDVIYVDPLNKAGAAGKGRMIVKSDRYDTVDAARAAAEGKTDKPADPKHSGKTFLGWALNWDENDNFVLVATYSDIPVKPDPIVSYVDPQTGKIVTGKKGEVSKPADPKAKNMQFVKWVKTTDAAGNTIFVAQYECDCSNGGGKSVDKSNVDTGDDAMLTVWMLLFVMAVSFMILTMMIRSRGINAVRDNYKPKH